MPDTNRFFFPIKEMLFIFITFIITACASIPQYEPAPFTVYSKEEFEALSKTGHELQVNTVFPLPMKAYDDSILPNNYIPFTAYKGQATIYLMLENTASFTLFLNDIKLETAAICPYTAVRIDISALAQNGKNVLYIANIAAKQKTAPPRISIKIPYPVLVHAEPHAALPVYMQEVFSLLDQLIGAETAYGFPGAQLLIAKNGTILKNTAYGSISTVDAQGNRSRNTPSVTPDTLFDIASNTKMYAANFAIQKLISEKKLFLTDSVQSFFPDFTDKKTDRIKGKESITVFDLLTHQSGFPAGGRYFKKLAAAPDPTPGKNRERTRSLIMETPFSYPPRTATVYSDINYMLLTFIIEKAAGMPLGDYVRQHFYEPLGLSRICFKPLKQGFRLNEIAATEYKRTGRTSEKPLAESGTLIHGTVHDEEAFYAMEQVSGHAGLFANAESLAVLAQIMLNGGGYSTLRFFDPAVTGYFTMQHTLTPNVALGWRRQGPQAYTWAFSPRASEHTFGHTGWTGTLTLIDPQEQLIIILLTNAKNTPPAKNGGSRFEGDYYLLKRYGAITALVYEALGHPNSTPDSSRLDSIVQELAEWKYTMLTKVQAFKNAGYRKDLAAIMDVVRQRAPASPALQHFLQSETAQEIEKELTSLLENEDTEHI
ncbi:MAG: penicillin binding protein PBP4B [Treponema sp.]